MPLSTSKLDRLLPEIKLTLSSLKVNANYVQSMFTVFLALSAFFLSVAICVGTSRRQFSFSLFAETVRKFVTFSSTSIAFTSEPFGVFLSLDHHVVLKLVLSSSPSPQSFLVQPCILRKTLPSHIG